MLQEVMHNAILLETAFHLVLTRSVGLRAKVLYSGLFAMKGAWAHSFLSLFLSVCS